ncbi:MAG: cation transporter dimerization domain-containing protein [Casimicrobiaceae bacterium]
MRRQQPLHPVQCHRIAEPAAYGADALRTEDQFIAAIDCCFPYADDLLAGSLIDEACALSANAAFMVAHEMATALEADIRTGLGGNVEVESHIEPQPMTLFYGREASAKVKAQVSATLIRLAKQEKSLKDLHNIRIRETDAGLFVHYHCRFSSKMNVEGVHAAVDRLETRFMLAQPKVRRVVAHAEPLGRAKHEL